MPQNIAKTKQGPIEYRLEGSGPTVLVLNGGHCSRESRLSHEHLTEYGFSVLTPSRPGYDNTPSDVGKTAQAAADALAALLETLQIPMADVIGISAAGPTALAFAQRHPDKVRKLILESAVDRLGRANEKALARTLRTCRKSRLVRHAYAVETLSDRDDQSPDARLDRPRRQNGYQADEPGRFGFRKANDTSFPLGNRVHE